MTRSSSITIRSDNDYRYWLAELEQLLDEDLDEIKIGIVTSAIEAYEDQLVDGPNGTKVPRWTVS